MLAQGREEMPPHEAKGSRSSEVDDPLLHVEPTRSFILRIGRQKRLPFDIVAACIRMGKSAREIEEASDATIREWRGKARVVASDETYRARRRQRAENLDGAPSRKMAAALAGIARDYDAAEDQRREHRPIRFGDHRVSAR